MTARREFSENISNGTMAPSLLGVARLGVHSAEIVTRAEMEIDAKLAMTTLVIDKRPPSRTNPIVILPAIEFYRRNSTAI
jgi:hypothetical protein